MLSFCSSTENSVESADMTMISSTLDKKDDDSCLHVSRPRVKRDKQCDYDTFSIMRQNNTRKCDLSKEKGDKSHAVTRTSHDSHSQRRLPKKIEF